MSYPIEITKPTSINNQLFDKGEVVNVSKSIYDLKIAEGVAKDFVVKKEKTIKEETK